ncbi:MAG: YIP1 family protein [Pelotomaculum sp.]|uniref:Yip1 domain-containing protein n=1 Tax=Pelotomaculum thermopropionicum (strain DSM 13744 / JCM 10971 / SI) TaxID=370438 RepID=A5CY98_PELTS|nr:YIP1 family protein [Pelotomaculum sp.]BAF61022.1 hypothetical protein PTH_2841 [Pelotomaculum thermopropionicum SI]
MDLNNENYLREEFKAPDGGERPPGFLELVYGVLFEPGKTMQKVAGKPPLWQSALVVTLLGVLGAVMGLLTFTRVVNQSLYASGMGHMLPAVQAFAPLGAILGLVWGYVKWFVYSAVLHLAAELLGGRGKAAGVFAVAGLAGLPTIFMLPVQLLAYWFGTGRLAATVLVGLAGLAVLVWTMVLLVIGVRHVHGFTTGRAVLVVFTPVLAMAAIAVLLVVAAVAVAASMPAKMIFPGYF